MNGRTRRWKTAFWWAAAAAQILFLCGAALRAGGAVIDNDAAKVEDNIFIGSHRTLLSVCRHGGRAYRMCRFYYTRKCQKKQIQILRIQW